MKRSAHLAVLTVSIAGLGVACTDGDEGRSSGPSPAATTIATEAPVQSSVTTTLATEAPVQSSVTTTLATEVPVQSSATPDGFRFSFDGGTVAIPREVASDARVDVVRSALPAVRVELLNEGVFSGEIVIHRVRNGQGVVLAAATPDELSTLRRLDNEVARSPDQTLDFVNGTGVRSVIDGDYHFTGITADGEVMVQVSRLVDVTETDAHLAPMDRLVGSLFVDGEAGSLAVHGCEYDLRVVSEVAVDGGTDVAPGAVVTARWRVANTGTCVWTSLDTWVFAGGDVFEFTDSSDLDGVVPGEEREVSVTFRAPRESGSFSSQWQFMPAGSLDLIGPPVPVTIHVV